MPLIYICCLSAGVVVFLLAENRKQMGDHSIQITVDTYGHLIPGANRQAVNRLAAMV